jgi:aquaporin Z
MRSLHLHWPEYLIEGGGLCLFMIGAGITAVLLEAPASPVRGVLPEPGLRRAVFGLAMGAIVVALVYSPWGKRSGAHFNPAMTLTFWWLGKVADVDALSFAAAQFIGGLLGVVATALLFGSAFTGEPVAYIVTVPGETGPAIALLAEFSISLALMLVVLTVSNQPRLARFTGVCAAALVAAYIAFEAPLSGMSMNPARSFASALPAMTWDFIWIYFLAPTAGMLCAAGLYGLFVPHRPVACAKLLHPAEVRCIHCGHDPLHPSRDMIEPPEEPHVQPAL